MRKLLILCFVAALAVVALPAQTPARPGAQPAGTTKNTNPSSIRPRSGATLAPTGKSTLQPASSPRQNTTPAFPSETPPAANLRNSSATSANTAERPANNRTTTPSKASATTTTKTVPAQMPAAAPLQQNEPMVKVQWMSIEEALEKSKTDKRKIFIDVMTDWCGWCKRMDESTFVDPEVAQYLNDNYYAVKFNAEQQQDISFNNKTYHFRKNGARGYHELAAEWLNNRLSFPTAVFLDESMNVIQPIPGYLEAPKLETILNYFGTDSHKTTPWETYEKKFNSNNQR